MLCARDGAELDRAAGELRAEGAQLITVTGDITDDGMAQRLVDAAVEQYGRLDILVNNAGVIQVGPVPSTGRPSTRRRWPRWPWRRCAWRWPRSR